MGGRTKGGRPKSPPQALEERVKKAFRRAGRPCTITDIRHRSGVRPKSATLRAALANLLEGGEIRTTTEPRGIDPLDPVRYRRGLVLYELSAASMTAATIAPQIAG
jgi:hypothetical protein